jgi:dolichol kinase
MKELPRRLWHIFAGLPFPVAGLLAPHDIFLPVLISITVGALILDMVRLMSPRVNRGFITVFRPLLREGEIPRLNGSTYFLIAASIVFIFCGQPIAAIALVFVVVGDPIAGMVGERWAKPRVRSEEQKISEARKFPRYLRFRGARGKSLEGSVACLVVCLVVGVMLAAVTHVPLWVVVVGAISAAVTEFVSLWVDDNLSVPLVAAGVMSLAQAIMV